jgi:SEC-C motif-containing protein
VVIKVLKKMLAGKPRVDYSEARRNDACPCGSGKKFKACHYDREASKQRDARHSKVFQNPK